MRETPAHPAQATANFLNSQSASPALQNCQLSLSFGESMKAAQLRESWHRVAARHGILRSSFRKAPTGEFLRQEREAAEAQWRTLDWSSVPGEELGARWKAACDEDAAEPLEAGKAPAIRFLAIDLPGGHCHLLITFPKLLLDEESLFRIICDWLAAFDGELAPLEPVETAVQATPQTADWWSRFFSDAAEPSQLEFFPRPSEPAPRSSAKVQLDREISAQLGKADARTVVLAAWALVVGRLSSRNEAIFLSSVRLPFTECGFSENLLPCRISFDENASISNWLKTVAKSEEERLANAGINLERVFSLSRPVRRLRDFQIGFRWLPEPLNDRVHGAFPRWINLDAQIMETTSVPLLLDARAGDRISLQIFADSTVCAPRDAEKLLARLIQTINHLLEHPSDKLGKVDVLLDAENPPVPVEVRHTSTLYIEEEVAAVAAKYPDALAIQGAEDAALSYSELDSHANSLAAWLRQESLADDWNLAVCLTPTPWLPVAVLGTLRAGDTCVPLDPTSSPKWLVAQLEACDVEMVLCDSGTAPLFEGSGRKTLVLDQQWEAVSSAPVTSAKSATPKTAFVLCGTEKDPAPPLRALKPDLLVKACRETARLWRLAPGSRVGLHATAGTGAFVETLLASLASGATLLLPEEGNPFGIIDTATHANLSTAQWQKWMASASESDIPESLAMLCIAYGGAAPAFERWRAWNAGRVRWIHHASPANFSSLGVRYLSADDHREEGDSALGWPGPIVTTAFDDGHGHNLPPYVVGELKISLDDAILPIRAWRDASGCFYPIPRPAEKPVEIAEPVAIPEAKVEHTPAPTEWEPLHLFHKSADAPLLFLVHDLDGDFRPYQTLAAQLEGDWTIYGTTARGLHQPSASHRSMEAEAASLVEAICLLDPDGPYHFFGYGYGAVLAFEMARQLRVAGRDVAYLALAGSRPPQMEKSSWMKSLARNLTAAVRGESKPTVSTPVAAGHFEALQNYKAKPLPGAAGIILGSDLGKDVEAGWQECAPDAFVERINPPSSEMLKEPAVKRLAVILRECAAPSADE